MPSWLIAFDLDFDFDFDFKEKTIANKYPYQNTMTASLTPGATVKFS